MRALHAARRLLVPILALATAAAAPAQRDKFENLAEGYRIFVHKSIKAVPTEPNERQAIAKWSGSIEFKDKLYRGNADCTALLVRIQKQKGPATGAAKDAGKGGDQEGNGDGQSVRDEAIETRNSGTTLEDFLKLRGLPSSVQSTGDEKPLKSKDGVAYAQSQVGGQVFDDRKREMNAVPVVRSYLLEDDQELFGIVALGPWLDPWKDIVEDMAKSLQRTQLGAEDADPAAASKFGNQEFRDAVRKKLVKGWRAFDTEHFVFVTNSKDSGLIQQILVDLELMRLNYIERFPPVQGVDLDKVISAVRFCSTYDDYEAYGGPPGTGGYWNFVDEELVLVDMQTLDPRAYKKNPSLKDIQVLDILYHEAMHQYFFYANGNLAPASWFNEGYGEVFAGAVPDRRKNEIRKIDKNKFRLAVIKQAQKSGNWPDLRRLLRMTQQEFYGQGVLLNYAFGWAFCFFLDEQRKDPKGNKEWAAIPDAYLENLRKATQKKKEELKVDDKDKKWLVPLQDELQKAAFEATFSKMDLSALQQAWIEEMKSWRR